MDKRRLLGKQKFGQPGREFESHILCHKCVLQYIILHQNAKAKPSGGSTG